jgi:hypothetical protein
MLICNYQKLDKMKSLKIIGYSLFTLLMASCNKVMDKSDLSKLSPDLLFSDSVLVQLNMDNIYEVNMPLFGGQNTGSSLSGTQTQLSEEGQSSGNVYMEGTMSYGSNEPKDFGTSLNTNNTTPNTNWGKIRQLNRFI